MRRRSFTVCETGCAYDSIPAAVAGAASGDTITVAPGNYAFTTTMTIDKPLTLLGPNSGVSPVSGTRGAEAVIDGTGVTTMDGHAFHIASGTTDVTIDGFAFKGSGIVASAVTEDITIQHNAFTEVAHDSLAAIQTYEGLTSATGWDILDTSSIPVCGEATPASSSRRSEM